MRSLFIVLWILQSLTLSATAQAFKDFAPDMAMKNLHNELELRRQNKRGSLDAKFNNTVKNYTSLIVLSWMVANREQNLPPGAFLDSMMQKAERSLDAAGVFDNRNLDIDVMLFTSREFEALQTKWQTTRGHSDAEKRLSDQTWQSFKERYNIDLREVKLEDFLE